MINVAQLGLDPVVNVLTRYILERDAAISITRTISGLKTKLGITAPTYFSRKNPRVLG